MENTVRWNVKPSPSHMDLPICSDVSLHVSLSLSARSDMHNKTSGCIQRMCKKLNFHNRIKTRLTLSNTCHAVLLSFSHQDMHIHKMKSITRKHCSLHYTYRRNCSSTRKTKLTATHKDGRSLINSHRKPVTELSRMSVPNLNIQIKRYWLVIGYGPEPKLMNLLTPVVIGKRYLPLHPVTSTSDHI